MADWALYWPQYRNESGENGEPVTGWLTSRDWLVKRLRQGDRLWLFIGGDACGERESPHQAYLAQLQVVKDWSNFEGHELGVRGSPQYRINAIEDRCMLVDPPALVDEILRQPGRDLLQHIGVARQTPFELDGGQVTRLITLMRERCPHVYVAATRA